MTVTVRFFEPEDDKGDNMSRQDTLQPQTGDYVEELLWTDTRVYEVVGRTERTVTLRHTQRGPVVKNQTINGNPYPVTFYAAMPSPDATGFVLRRRKDGTYRTGRGMNPLRPASVIDGQPVQRVDYRY
jgi:hypothetical protein